MARYFCKRCGADCNTLDQAHLCKDVQKRYERNAKAIGMVRDILLRTIKPDCELCECPEDFTYHQSPNWGQYSHTFTPPAMYEEAATEIVKALSGRDLGVD